MVGVKLQMAHGIKINNKIAMEKEDIIDRKNELSANQLFDYIVKGIVTYDDLITDQYDPLSKKLRDELTPMINNMDVTLSEADEKAWKLAKEKNTPAAYMKYMDEYPQGIHYDEARGELEKIKEQNQWNSLDKNSIEALEKYLEINTNSAWKGEACKLLDDLKWGEVNKQSKESIENFIKINPNSSHIPDANSLLSILSRPKDDINKIFENYVKGKFSYDDLNTRLKENGYGAPDICKAIENNPNIIFSSDLKKLIKENVLTKDQACNINGLKCFVDYIYDEYKDKVDVKTICQPIVHIDGGRTAVYFWGFPSSGKTCAIGTILKALGESSFEPEPSQGYNYMNSLRDLFNSDGEIFKLPPGTTSDNIFDMKFLYSNNNKSYPVSCVDLAGEVLMGMDENNGAVANPDSNPSLKVLNDLLIISVNNNNYGDALKYIKQLVGKIQNLKDRDLQDKILMNIGISYEKMGKEAESQKYISILNNPENRRNEFEYVDYLDSDKAPYGTIGRRKAMDTLYNIFVRNSSKDNRNIHFFVIEYGADKKKYSGSSQQTLLDAAVAYLKKYEIFKNNTDGIYIIVTKSDKTGLNGDERNVAACQYVEEKYNGFWKSLGEICKKYEINGGKMPGILPFSIGEVRLGDLCKSDIADANKVVDIIEKSAYGTRNDGIGKIFKLGRN